MDFEGAFFDTNLFRLTDQKLGEGVFGKVYVVERIEDKKKFAAKMINPQGMLNGTDQLRFLRESQILNKLKHKAIVQFFGINFHSFEDNTQLEPTILTEYVVNGSLRSVLDKERTNSHNKQWNATKKYICLLGIANAMQYLHANKVIHRDLKTPNVLLDENFYPHVCDFGISRCFSEELSNSIQISMTGGIGSPIYMAPELFEEDGLYGSSIDVYAFAIVAFEIVTGLIPYSHHKKKQNQFQLSKRVLKNERPQFNDKATQKMIELIQSCWSMDPYDRPTFSEIFHLLSSDFTFSKEPVNKNEVNAYIKSLGVWNQIERSSPLISQCLSDLFFDVTKLIVGDLIRHGTISSFYESVLPASADQPETKYVLKVVDQIESLNDQQDLFKSIELHSSLKHPGIIRLIGFAPPTEDSNHYSVVIELAPNGSLEDLIDHVKRGKKPVDWETVKAIIIFGTAAAMAYIHQHNVTLADLRPMSVLLDQNYQPKIGGFVNAFFLPQGTQSHNESPQKGIPLYMAPELINDLAFSNKIDVFAYGITLLHLLTLKKPSINSNSTPTIGKGDVPEKFAELIQLCSSLNPDVRPSFMQIVQMFMKKKSEYFDMRVVNETKFDEYIEMVTKDLSFW